MIKLPTANDIESLIEAGNGAELSADFEVNEVAKAEFDGWIKRWANRHHLQKFSIVIEPTKIKEKEVLIRKPIKEKVSK